MKIKKIKVKNYRLLQDFCIDLEDELSLVIGKNNTGKTSLLSVLDKFLNPSDRKQFSYNDFNIENKQQLYDLVQNVIPSVENYTPFGIRLRIFIEYNDSDNLEHISSLMMDLNPENNFIVLGFDFVLHHSFLENLREDFQIFKQKEAEKKANNAEYEEKGLNFFLDRNATNYFNFIRKTVEYDLTTSEANEDNYKDLVKEKISIQNVLNFKFISAKREVSNRDVDKTLSSQTSKLYKKSEESTEQQNAIEEFQDKLIDTDIELSDIYSGLFKEVIEKVKKFGGIKQDDSQIEILSTLQHRELLEGNTTVMYNQFDSSLPESYNGLGYMNLISMIFEIEYLVSDFRRLADEVPADINLLFIEEPEAHTHPQMQSVFIKNIKELLKEGIKREDGNNRKLQYLISTHSSHIVSESDYDDIKYLKKTTDNNVVAKNIKDLEKEYEENGEQENYRFLKQYLTLNRAELFFADKAILIEGDTERILLPAMMKKFDNEYHTDQITGSTLPLLSQNISIVEVGAYSQIFEKFIDFIGVKTLIITDIDSFYEQVLYETDGVTPKCYGNGNVKKETVKCFASNSAATHTSNTALHFFHGNQKKLNYYTNLDFDAKILKKDNCKIWMVNTEGDVWLEQPRKWISSESGNVLLVFQTPEANYHARSFEDAFFHINSEFIKNKNHSFNSLTSKYLKKFKSDEISVFDFSEQAVNSKPSLAIEILLNSKTDIDGNLYSNWQTPAYINEGLTWLKED
ncbi:ATP-dependent endonuclease [Flammeovirga sp. SJP92]|uniref:ATP-dependent nuclease n=1 Tax=Flammeovirga sp. SJP92 TaxID=1775430 RepID=UPI0007880A47|nr:ATP-dependent endonuclease [Flammeovirga sp. SJP92]KXX71676.1 hypothetical protein AVL50_05225 [Flammeovirga sp. SJP92]